MEKLWRMYNDMYLSNDEDGYSFKKSLKEMQNYIINKSCVNYCHDSIF